MNKLRFLIQWRQIGSIQYNEPEMGTNHKYKKTTFEDQQIYKKNKANILIL
jgi:hypothetical protein